MISATKKREIEDSLVLHCGDCVGHSLPECPEGVWQDSFDLASAKRSEAKPLLKEYVQLPVKVEVDRPLSESFGGIALSDPCVGCENSRRNPGNQRRPPQG
eukprot:5983958-Amphidinium_carterae.1